MKQRHIKKVWDVNPRPGMGPHLQVSQIIPPGSWEELDPFLLLNEDWFRQGTFDFHPHRGIETVTYVIEGKLKHEDNHGGSGILAPGDVQWMTAGRGIVHSEDPMPGETVHSLQLWVNLPSNKKMTEPRYQDLSSGDIPIREEEGAEVRVFSGSSGDIESNTQNHVPVTFVEMTLEKGASITQQLPGDFNGFFYILEGSGRFGQGETQGEKNQALMMNFPDQEEETEISIQADEPLRVLLYAGKPVKEKVVAHGPFVMNTEDEIRQAFEDYRSGKF